jgi:hypothetical protein
MINWAPDSGQSENLKSGEMYLLYPAPATLLFADLTSGQLILRPEYRIVERVIAVG